MKRIKYVWHWIIGLSFNIMCDFLFLIIGIFSKETRRLYIEKFYPHLLKKESEEE